MAGKKISALNPLTPLDGTEEAVVETAGQNYRVTTQDIADLGGGGSGSTITIGTEPVSPAIGDYWIDFSGNAYIWASNPATFNPGRTSSDVVLSSGDTVATGNTGAGVSFTYGNLISPNKAVFQMTVTNDVTPGIS